MRKKFTIAAIVLGFIGAVLGMLAAWRIEKMFTANSISLGFGKEYDSWFWNHSLLLSFVFGALAFISEFIAVFLEKEHKTENRPIAKEIKTIMPLLFVLAATLLNGCSTSSPIQKYSESKSHFSGKPTMVSEAPIEGGLYRVYQQGATGFVSIQDVRQTAEKRAVEFCERQGKTMRVVSEHVSKPPYILGNFPRIEIVFACVDKPKTEQSAAFEDVLYKKLTNLKKLLDEGAITKEEFDREKSKILNDK